jgi:hypothetical protein
VDGQPKQCDRMEYGETLTVTENSTQISLELHAVIVHVDYGNGKGHYYSYVKCPGNEWMKFDDSKASKASVEDVFDANFGGQKRGRSLIKNQPTAAMLIYVRVAGNLMSSQVASISSKFQPDPATAVGYLDNFWNQKYCPELSQLRAQVNIPHYICKPSPESLQTLGQKPVDISHCRTPFLEPPSMFINDACIDWFFMALTCLFPAYMYLPCTLCGFKAEHSAAQACYLQIWKANFFLRCPIAVLLPVNIPLDCSKCISKKNPGLHWVLIAMRCAWEKKNDLSSVTVTCMDSLNDKDAYIKPALDWFNISILPIFSVPVTFQDLPAGKLQTGNNNHCGAYCMAFGLNFVMCTLESMCNRLIPAGYKDDSSAVGLTLREMAVWDSVQDPPLLDACLYMCPLFHQFSGDKGSYHHFWFWSPHYDLRKSLNMHLNSSGKFLISGYAHGKKNGMHFHHEIPDASNDGYGFSFGISSICVANHVATDGPFFFSNDDYFVKVYCIGLLGHFQQDRISISRARRAFHDASATSFFCKQMGWFYKSFGLICTGLATPCCFVCIARQKLQKPTSSPNIGSICVDLTDRTSAMHNDVHPANVLWNPTLQRYELVDCERASLITGVRRPSAFFYSWYASSVASKKHIEVGILMDILHRSGLGATSDFFSQIYSNNGFLTMAFDAALFETCPKTEWAYDAFLHLMELLIDHNPIISGKTLSPSVSVTIESFACTITLARSASGHADVISATSGPQQPSIFTLPLKLKNHCDTIAFFNMLQIPSTDQGTVIKHGILCTADSLFHYDNGSLFRGFFIQNSKLSTIGFSSIGTANPVDFAVDSSKCQVFTAINGDDDKNAVVNRFVGLLNSKKFCCPACCESNWFTRFASTIICSEMFATDCFSSNTRSAHIGFKRGKRYFKKDFGGSLASLEYNQALFCLFMLGTFLNVDIWKDCDEQSLIASVQHDCNHGFILNTLAFLKTE